MKCTFVTLTFFLLSITCLAQQNRKVQMTVDGVTYTAISETTPDGERGPTTGFQRIVLSNSVDDTKGIMYSAIGLLYEMWCFDNRIAIIGRTGRYGGLAVFNRITMEPVDHFIAPLCERSPSGRYISFVQMFREFPDLPSVNTHIAVVYDLTQTPILNRVIHEHYPIDAVAGIPFYPKVIAETGKVETPNPVDITDYAFHWDSSEDILVVLAKSFEPEVSSLAWIDFRTSSTTVYHKTINLEAEAAKHQLKVNRENGRSGLNVTKISTPKQDEALAILDFKGGKLDLMLTPETADEVWDVPLP